MTERLHFHALEKEMATYSSILAWRIPGTGEPGGLPSVGSCRVGHDWSDLAAAAAAANLVWFWATYFITVLVDLHKVTLHKNQPLSRSCLQYKNFISSHILYHMYSTLFHMLYLSWIQAEEENPISWTKGKDDIVTDSCDCSWSF